MKPDPVFFIVITLVIIALAVGSELVRLMMAGALALGAIPLWKAVQRFFQKQFWRDVENIIVASDEQPSKLPPSDQA